MATLVRAGAAYGISVRLAGVAMTATLAARGSAAKEETPQVRYLADAAEPVCDGYDEEWSQCPGLPDCHACRPVDCIFGLWGDWYNDGGCTGLMSRHRRISVPNNECGAPCNGTKSESKSYMPKECRPTPVNCKLSEWSDWSKCTESSDQTFRSRGVDREPRYGGSPCQGVLKQTTFCGYGPVAIDCKVSEWHTWSECSASCDQGLRTRMRRILVMPKHGGLACVSATMELGVCKKVTCPDQDCTLSAWSDWTMCATDQQRNSDTGRFGRVGSFEMQRYRRRKMITFATLYGKPCDAPLMQIEGCEAPKASDCSFTEWEEWRRCDKSCDGGQSFRSRRVKEPNYFGGVCHTSVLRETRMCSTQPCLNSSAVDCRISAWNEWTDCSASCGKGSMSRLRMVAKTRVQPYGKGCSGALQEIAVCKMPPCLVQDCAWTDWYDWSDCSVTCSGGTRERHRAVAASPRNGGIACQPLLKSEAVACLMQPCPNECIDGKWTSWRDWSSCSSTCGGGYRSRRRDVEQEPSECGKPTSGVPEEFGACPGLPSCTEDLDCKLSAWESWSSCSCSCFGVRERSRLIRVFAAGRGRPCDRTLRQLESCNPGPRGMLSRECVEVRKRDCSMAPWAMWSACTRTCQGGQRERRRYVDNPAAGGGNPCEGDLVITESCNKLPCSTNACNDCKWGKWSNWGDCDCYGQRFRRRSVVEVRNHCGKPCDSTVAREVMDCPRSWNNKCDGVSFCTWSDWTHANGCDASCGADSTFRSRMLTFQERAPVDFLFMAPSAAKCAGAQIGVLVCNGTTPCKQPCKPQHCKLAAWSEWSAATCVGLCERSRVVKRVNNECGAPCKGAMMETRRCPIDCDEPQDCLLAQWGDWSSCYGGHGQKMRSRSVARREEGGIPCEGVLLETEGCDGVQNASCRLSGWSDWSPCPRTCGASWQTRTRRILDEAQGGGLLCWDSLEEMQPCELSMCPQIRNLNCILGSWTEWSSCAGSGQRIRERAVAKQLEGEGVPCNGSLQETTTCGLVAVDCTMAEWTPWDLCDKTCGGGQQHRHRTVKQYPQNSGRPCPSMLAELRGCGFEKCPAIDCQVIPWATWGECSASCGVGQIRRQRRVMRERNRFGKPCEDALEEIQPCELRACPRTDCGWGVWSEWSACTCTCGGGQRTRSRDIAKKPLGSGSFCNPQGREEVQACSVRPCQKESCVDGLWGDWLSWSPCSRSCGGGLSFRTRGLVQMASQCGKPAVGKDREEAWCNVRVTCERSLDCLFTDWGDWGGCSASCNGVMARARQVGRYGRGDGLYCNGGLRETVPCNPGVGQSEPSDCENAIIVNCLMSDWSHWTECSATCGGGQHLRSRSVVKQPSGGGNMCEGRDISAVRECARGSCPGPEPVDCLFGDWDAWGACSKCGGQRKRFRSIRRFPAHGGRNCDTTAQEETMPCPRMCDKKKYCTWGDWENWEPCTAECGHAKRSRRRYLNFSDAPAEPPDPLLAFAKYSEDEDQQGLWSSDIPETWQLLVAFASGMIVLIAPLSGLRSPLSTARRRRAAVTGARGMDSRSITPQLVAPSHEQLLRMPLSS